MKLLTIIIPTYNEEKSVQAILRRISKLRLENAEVIIVDDSKDKTAEVARKVMNELRLKGKVIKRKNERGKGSAIAKGIEVSNGRYIVTIDADCEYPPEYIPKILERLKSCDLVLARRARSFSLRAFLSYGFRAVYFLLFNTFEETQAGIKGFKRSAIRKVGIFHDKYWVWDLELFLKVKYHKLKYCSIPIIVSERKEEKSKISLLTAFKMFIDLLKLRVLLTERMLN